MTVVRKSISLAPGLATRLEEAARERGTSVSEVIACALEKDLPAATKWELPFEYLFDGPISGPNARDIDDFLAKNWADDIARDR